MSTALLEQALAAIRAHREEARASGLDLIGVIGSVARGDARPDSDVDIVYAVVGHASLLDLGGLQMDLQDQLRRPVDMVDLNQVRPRVRAIMERDLVLA
ncbi:nucleotidyltransferase family protein [Phenylobacterium sp.]|uniref:nucleotidyltransferase family protein n=1 Tax=Phenylobacterium sp. TaxID=1871053 RepID=UPI0037CBCA4A